jgi:O-methyltransferase
MTRAERKPNRPSSQVVELLLGSYPLLSGKVSKDCLRDILDGLQYALNHATPGAIVELGCNVGTTSVFIQRLNLFNPLWERPFHVYDSWEGLPEPSDLDIPDDRPPEHPRGTAKTSREVFEQNFREAGLHLPVIHDGWFKDAEYPEPIAFAFFDGDFYSSIMDSFWAVWPRLSPGGIIVVHDYEYPQLPGVKRAVEDFLVGPRGVTWTKGRSHTCTVVKP